MNYGVEAPAQPELRVREQEGAGWGPVLLPAHAHP